MATKTKTATSANADSVIKYNWSGRTVPVTMAKATAWPKGAGPRVTDSELAQAAALISRTGTAKHLALAMMLRDGGATQPEIIQATGDTAVNAYRDAITAGLTAKPVTGRAGHKAYALALPVKRASKGKGKGKGSKPAAEKPAAGTAEKPAGDATA